MADNNTPIRSPPKPKPKTMPDDNNEIIQLIQDRMKVGVERYGHGMRVDDDTTQYDTEQDSWLEMCLQELLDAIVYVTAALIRTQRSTNNKELQATPST